MAFVQSSSEMTQSATTATMTVTAGNLLVFYVSAFLTGTLTISDDKGNTWTRDVYQNIASAGIPGQVAIYSAPNAAGGSTTFTLSGAGGSGAWGRVLEFSGRATASVVDAFDSVNTVPGAFASTAGITGTGLDDVVAVYLFDRDARAISGPSGFTNIADGAAGFAWNGYRAGYNPSAETGTLTAIPTHTAGAIVAYKPAGGGGGSSTGAPPMRAARRIFLPILNH